MKWLKQKTTTNSKDSALKANNIDLNKSIKSSRVTNKVTLKDINSLMKTALVCIFVISCGQQSGIEKHGNDYYSTKKVKFNDKGKLPETIKEEPRYVPVQSPDTEEVIEVDPISDNRVELIEETQAEIEIPKTTAIETETEKRARWAEDNISSIHKKVGRKFYVLSPTITVTVNLKNGKKTLFKADINKDLADESTSVYNSREAFLLNGKQTEALVYCMDDLCEESNIELIDTKTSTHYSTIMSGKELKSTGTDDSGATRKLEITYTDIITKDKLSTTEIAKPLPQSEDIDADTNPEKKDTPAPIVDTEKPESEEQSHDHGDDHEQLTHEDFDTVTKTTPEASFTRNQFSWPVAFDSFSITSFIGKRNGKNHHGVDLGKLKNLNKKIPIKSIADGIVTYSGEIKGYGNTVKVKYVDKLNPKITYQALFAHMTTISFLKPGDTISEGFVIGYMGKTGNSTGVHLHLEIKNLLTGALLNPLELLKFTTEAKCNKGQKTCNKKYYKNPKTNPNLVSADLTS